MTTVQETPLYTSEQLAKLNPRNIPKHIAIIPDGNRRWAKENRILPEEGHRKGADTLLDIIKASAEIGVETLTFYVFSTENWSRPKHEIKAQMWLLEKSLNDQKQRMIDNGVRFTTIGDLTPFPEKIVQKLNETIEATHNGKRIDVVFALNYGGRDDIRRATEKIVEDVEAKRINKVDITEELISRYLDTAPWPDPDLLIRTSGENRVSNFLLWQISYAEFYLTDLYWPEFTPAVLLDAIQHFQSRERRRGGS